MTPPLCITDWNGDRYQGDPDESFWRCPQTGRDCRQASRPALAVIPHDSEQQVEIRMYLTEAAADMASSHTVAVRPGEPGHFVRGCMHIAEKAWMAPHGTKLLDAMGLIVRQFFLGVP